MWWKRITQWAILKFIWCGNFIKCISLGNILWCQFFIWCYRSLYHVVTSLYVVVTSLWWDCKLILAENCSKYVENMTHWNKNRKWHESSTSFTITTPGKFKFLIFFFYKITKTWSPFRHTSVFIEPIIPGKLVFGFVHTMAL